MHVVDMALTLARRILVVTQSGLYECNCVCHIVYVCREWYRSKQEARQRGGWQGHILQWNVVICLKLMTTNNTVDTYVYIYQVELSWVQ